MKIVIKKKNVYGENMYYPVCKDSKLFADIAGTITLTIENLERIREIGFRLELQKEEIE
jgi:hypothetical protein|tara:strand:- start:394 stop:570 length:177 start_codon:yes stop_codon:yes gene_type:complete